MKKILLVDDLKTVIETEKNILSRANFKIFTATSGKEALDIHRKEKVDLIIADIEMPEMSGDLLCSTIRKNEGLKKVSIIIVCNNREADLERCHRCGANAYITKPVDRQRFFEKASQFLNISGRKNYRVLVKAKIEGRFLDAPFFCSSRDISATGMLVETDKSLAKGNIISCSFHLPDSEHILSKGEVMRVVMGQDGKNSYGIRFIDLEPQYSSGIEAFINKATKRA